MGRSVRLSLAALLVVLLAIAGYRAWKSTGRTPAPSDGASGREAAARGPGEPAPPAVPDVRLGELETRRVPPAPEGRNPFRFEVKPPAPPAVPVPPPSAGAAPRPEAPPRPPGPPPPAPIALKFIGILDALKGPGKIAVLSDGRFVFHGRVGDIIDGRYRIVSIGVESIVLEHVDGRGRQTIRLSGS